MLSETKIIRKTKRLNQIGMTLVEIMVVIAIIAGITSVLVSTVTGRLKAAKLKQAKIQLAEVGKALEVYYTDCGSYPSPEVGLKALLEAPEGCSNWGPEPYLKKFPKDPWGHDFVYTLSGNNYSLKSLGADGKEGGTGADADISTDDL